MTNVSRMFPAEITEQPATYLESIGKVFARFGADTHDSANISYGDPATAFQRFRALPPGDSRYAVLQEGVTTRFPSYLAFHNAWRAA